MIRPFQSSRAQKVVLERDRKAEEFVATAVPWGTKTFSLAAAQCHNFNLSNKTYRLHPNSFPRCWTALASCSPFSARTESSYMQVRGLRGLLACVPMNWLGERFQISCTRTI